ncbi:hypothetical protein L1987_11390 [Smallanthus sonchifolius]|uniref:Uncharacterized protein n=1 Tax=Smallanthus sonchifolius TaxID=185202 RepID=A0ACB9JDG8_9ASTR|nr:hypothetical protein L1987_11390 [Smallanthus sonchifolius]
MVSFIASSSARQLISPVVSSLGLSTNFKITPRVSFILVKKVRVCGCKELKETRTRSGVSCEGYLDSEAELALEREILVFMKNSRNPNEFPTKKQLLDAGRVDLVNAIAKTGGWLALGWDYSENENDFETDEFDDVRELQTRVEGFQHRHDVYDSSQHSASPTGRSLVTKARKRKLISVDGKWVPVGLHTILHIDFKIILLISEMLAEEDTGVEGILSRLEKHRSLSFDIHMEKNMHGTYASSNDNGGFTDFNMTTDVAANIDSRLQERQRHNNNNNKDLNADKIRSRLQHMQLELSSAIHSLRSSTLTLNPEVHESYGSELQQLSDVWEFQENEVMKAGDKLRSMRAKLAVLEGKIALSVIDTQKLVEEKQRRIDSARATLQLLRTTCIFWTHSASEVLLVGSFDGWTSQVKMEKTRTGIFSTSLKLYPGRYEIKFIVDGVWRIDPMLPVVHNNGYENNSLIVHESA